MTLTNRLQVAIIDYHLAVLVEYLTIVQTRKSQTFDSQFVEDAQVLSQALRRKLEQIQRLDSENPGVP